ncbi:META domain-containing protein [Roseiconus nitratireducens]|uniref:META domain-containing protein n=2 Tax=Roseiconus nitratireducens TaxID=2605748 RepID=A0A5M6CVT4_9BACT|nr:META domain-containing protein [Roseiconus nitratireducens]
MIGSVRRLAAVIGLLAVSAVADAQPLPSWNDGPAKQAIVDFVAKVTTEDSPDFLAPQDRIAVFDNDGTLWPENPLPFQLMFALDELRRLAPDHPQWKQNPVIQAALDGDVAVLKKDLKKSLSEILKETHAGTTVDEFDQRVRDWLSTARHPRFDRPYNGLTYLPMQEVLAYLREHGFRTYIVSGGGKDFMRVWAEDTYGIPPEQVIGSMGPLQFEIRDGVPVLARQAGIDFIDDKEGKPVAIHRSIGRRPVAAFGNSDGDLAMLQWTTMTRSPSFGLIVHHTDPEREYAYDRDPASSGKLVTALEQSEQQGWVVVDMKRDWKTVFETTAASDGDMSLDATNWIAEDIGGRGVVDIAQSTLSFDQPNHVTGNTAVNRFSGPAKIDGRSLQLGPLATTRRAGPPALMDQENRFLKALSAVRSYRFDGQRKLLLLDEQGQVLVKLAQLDR